MCLIISGTVFYAIYAIIKLVIIERQVRIFLIEVNQDELFSNFVSLIIAR